MENEKKLIYLEDLFKFPIRIDHYDKENGSADFVYGVETVLEYAEYLPTVDAVEVVRCKDCTMCTEIGLPRCRMTGRHVIDSDFCSRGERRSDGSA